MSHTRRDQREIRSVDRDNLAQVSGRLHGYVPEISVRAPRSTGREFPTTSAAGGRARRTAVKITPAHERRPLTRRESAPVMLEARRAGGARVCALPLAYPTRLAVVP